MRFDLLIQNGTLVSSSGRTQADVGIVGGKITQIGSLSSASAARTLDAKNLLVLPGLIDTQVHFREPGMEHKEDIESGTRAAILGGVTSIFEMPNTNPPTISQAALEDKLTRAQGRAWCDYSFFIGASPENIDELPSLEMLPGTPGVKIFVGSSTGSLLVDNEEDLRRVLQSGRKRCPIHSEDEARNRERKERMAEGANVREHPNIRDAESARISTERVLLLSKETGRPVHILHVSTADELPLIAEAKKQGFGTTCEITPQHLFFHGPEAYDRLGTRVQQNPPIRSKEHQAALWKALDAGLFDVIGSDHAPHTLEEKAQAYPNSPSGMPGVQTSLSVLLTFASQGRMSIEQIVKLFCEGPAQIYGIANKGFLQEGYDADLVLVDPNAQYVFERSMVASKCGWSPFEGETFVGRPTHVLLRGQVQVEDSQLIGSQSGTPVEFKL